MTRATKGLNGSKTLISRLWFIARNAKLANTTICVPGEKALNSRCSKKKALMKVFLITSAFSELGSISSAKTVGMKMERTWK